MGWFKQRQEALNEALGARRYLLVPLFGGIVAVVDWVFTKLSEVGIGAALGLPPWSIGLMVSVSLVAWWLLEYAVKIRQRIFGVRVELSHLRAEGVRIRNIGRWEFDSEDLWLAWEQSATEWNENVIAEIRKINEADAEWFSILDVVPRPRLTVATTYEQHEKLYREHDFRVKRLGEMIQNLWRD